MRQDIWIDSEQGEVMTKPYNEPSKMKPIISRPNTKVKCKSFSLPPIKSCPNCRDCRKYCYALKAYRMYPSVRKAYDHNLKCTRRDDFVSQMIDLLPDTGFFRVHVSGDFYSTDYFRKWCEIAKRKPMLVLWAFTKNDEVFTLNRPKNLVVIRSIQGIVTHDAMPAMISETKNMLKVAHLGGNTPNGYAITGPSDYTGNLLCESQACKSKTPTCMVTCGRCAGLKAGVIVFAKH